MVTLPISPIKLAGFPLCHGDGNSCSQEVEQGERFCVAHGGLGPSVQVLRRTYLRQLRSAIEDVIKCLACIDIELNGKGRCKQCVTIAGAAWALGGLLERLGYSAGESGSPGLLPLSSSYERSDTGSQNSTRHRPGSQTSSPLFVSDS